MHLSKSFINLLKLLQHCWFPAVPEATFMRQTIDKMKTKQSHFFFHRLTLYALLPLCLFNLYSCNSEHIENVESPKDLEVIKVPEGDKIKAKFSDVFSEWKLIPLETTPESLIGNIRRISVFKTNYYILDRQTNSVLIFNPEGKFLNKIQRLGNRPGEYQGLMDFTIDEEKNQIILYSHKPMKLLVYDLSGNFISEERLQDLNNNLSLSGKDLFFTNVTVGDNHLLLYKNLETNEERKILPLMKNSKYFESFYLSTPTIIKGITTNISFPYSDTLYEARNKRILAKYRIDFGNKRLPADLIAKKTPPSEIFKSAVMNNYGFGVSNFKEFSNIVYFSYGPDISVIYNKKNKQTVAFKGVINDENYLLFKSFAHDGNDNKLITIYSANEIVRLIDAAKTANMMDSLPASFKDLGKKVSNVSNPLLYVCTLKEN